MTSDGRRKGHTGEPGPRRPTFRRCPHYDETTQPSKVFQPSAVPFVADLEAVVPRSRVLASRVRHPADEYQVLGVPRRMTRVEDTKPTSIGTVQSTAKKIRQLRQRMRNGKDVALGGTDNSTFPLSKKKKNKQKNSTVPFSAHVMMQDMILKLHREYLRQFLTPAFNLTVRILHASHTTNAQLQD